jgi:hypothetical protein
MARLIDVLGLRGSRGDRERASGDFRIGRLVVVGGAGADIVPGHDGGHLLGGLAILQGERTLEEITTEGELLLIRQALALVGVVTRAHRATGERDEVASRMRLRPAGEKTHVGGLAIEGLGLNERAVEDFLDAVEGVLVDLLFLSLDVGLFLRDLVFAFGEGGTSGEDGGHRRHGWDTGLAVILCHGSILLRAVI